MNTPQALFSQLDQEFNFSVALSEPDVSVLDMPWNQTVFVEPPRRGKNVWLQKAYEDSKRYNSTIVCLIPAKTDTAYWKKYCLKANELRFVEGRLTFESYQLPSMVPSVVVVFRPMSVVQPILSTYQIGQED